MKRLKFLFSVLNLLLILSLVAGVSACKKEDDDDDNNNNNNNNQAPTTTAITASVGGVAWSADQTTILGLYVQTIGVNSLAISGTSADNSTFTLSVNLWNQQTGSFATSVTGSSNIVGLTYEDANDNSFSAPSNNASATGTLHIDYWDGTKVKGRFSFTGGRQQDSQTVSVTNGEFSVLNVQ